MVSRWKLAPCQGASFHRETIEGGIITATLRSLRSSFATAEELLGIDFFPATPVAPWSSVVDYVIIKIFIIEISALKLETIRSGVIANNIVLHFHIEGIDVGFWIAHRPLFWPFSKIGESESSAFLLIIPVVPVAPLEFDLVKCSLVAINRLVLSFLHHSTGKVFLLFRYFIIITPMAFEDYCFSLCVTLHLSWAMLFNEILEILNSLSSIISVWRKKGLFKIIDSFIRFLFNLFNISMHLKQQVSGIL